MDNWNSVFDAHPKVTEIFIGTDKNGNKQPFLKKSQALNFAGGVEDKVQTLKRDEKPNKSKGAETTGSEETATGKEAKKSNVPPNREA